MRKVVLLSGRTCTGKSGLARRLAEQYGFQLVSSSELLRKRAMENGRPTDRTSLQNYGDEIDQLTDHKWLVEAFLEQAEEWQHGTPAVVDNIRTGLQLDAFRQTPGLAVSHVHLYASPAIELVKRFLRRNPELGDEETARLEYDKADLLKQLADIDSFRDDADVRVNTVRTDGRDTVVRVAARLGLLSPPNTRCVDVIVGAQFGSEGKGHVAAYLASNYDVLVRVGGPNAGHTVSSASGVYTYHQLPSGAKDTTARLLLGPGMTIDVKKLLKEIDECGISPDRLFIDPQAMIIEQNDIDHETKIVGSISSTGQGGGAASARRITGRGDSSTHLARDIDELRPYVGVGPDYRGSTIRQLEVAYARGESVLLEGTQGSGLSIYHGEYPYVTSRDTNVAGCLAEAGISPSRVRRVIMVTRLTPIRVADPPDGTSGPLKHEVTFEIVASQAGLDPEEVTAHEKTSTTHRPRRVGWFEWEAFRKACELNGPTDIVLTFADYVSAENQNARRFEQLSEDTIKFVEELERVAQAPVSLINTRFPRNPNEDLDVRTMIDRRNWSTRRHKGAN